MVTAVNERTYDLRGLSSDEKPYGPNVSNWDGETNILIANGSSFLEMDTATVYLFSIEGEVRDEEGKIETKGTGTWIKV